MQCRSRPERTRGAVAHTNAAHRRAPLANREMSGWGDATAAAGAPSAGGWADTTARQPQAATSGWGNAPAQQTTAPAAADGWGAPPAQQPAAVTDGWGVTPAQPAAAAAAAAGGGWGAAPAQSAHMPSPTAVSADGWGTATPAPVADGWGSIGPEVPGSAATDTSWGASLGGGGGGGGGDAGASSVGDAVGWGDAPALDPTGGLPDLDDLDDAVEDDDEDIDGSGGGNWISRSGSGAWVNPLNTPSPRGSSQPPPSFSAGDKDTLSKMGEILNSLASGGAAGGMPGSSGGHGSQDALALAQQRAKEKKRKASLSYKLR